MDTITLKVYDEKGEKVVAMYDAKPTQIMFGSIRTLMGVLKIENTDNQAELLGILADAWDEVVDVLERFFPECSKEEMDRVPVGQMLNVILKICKFAVTEAMRIPTDEKN